METQNMKQRTSQTKEMIRVATFQANKKLICFKILNLPEVFGLDTSLWADFMLNSS